jgi:hypothetical protein
MHDAGWAHFLACLSDLTEGRPFAKEFTPTRAREVRSNLKGYLERGEDVRASQMG